MNLAEEFVECFPPYAKCTVVSTSNVLILKRDTCSEDWFVLELLLLIRAWHSGLFSRLRRLGSKLNLTAAKMDATRALLDELMGKERDVPMDKKTNRARKFDDDDVRASAFVLQM